jgi:hypothetical protein
MPLIDTSYFIGPITIAQIAQPAVEESVEEFIELNERDFLEKAMGVGFTAAFLAGIEGSTVDPEARWTDLIEGKIYTRYGKQKRWVGLAGDGSLSPVAAYIYWTYHRSKVIQSSGVGFVQSQAENATVVDSSHNLNSAWNIMLTTLRELWDYLHTESETYPEYDSTQVDHCFFGQFLKNSFGI